MSRSFSNSSGKRHYARHDYGSDYYKRSDKPHSGILGWIFGLLFSSKRKHYSGHDYHGNSNYRQRRKSWS